MENKKSGIFLGVIGVATLIVAIIGATFAYFTATAGSNNDGVTAGSTSLALGYNDTSKTNLKANLIPAADNIALYAANNQTGTGSTANSQCVDDNANEVCSVYEFTIGNPNKTTAQTLYFSLTNVTNTFGHLYYAVYEVNAAGTLVADPVIAATALPDATALAAANKVIALSALNQTLAPSRAPEDVDKTLSTTAPAEYTLYTQTVGTAPNQTIQYNKRTYRMIFWIHEAGEDNVEADVQKNFTATLLASTSDGATGVTGQIVAAGQNEN